MMQDEYTCIRDEQIQHQSRKIEGLEVRADFKEQQIQDLIDKMDKLNDKLDKVIEGFNELKMQSKADDKELELRLKAIETELALQKQTTKDNYNKLSIFIAGVTIVFTALTFFMNYLH